MKASDLVAIAVIAAGLFWPQLKEKLPLLVPGPAPAPSPNVVVPDAAAQAAVAPVKALLAGKPERTKFANYFAMYARSIEISPGSFSTVGAIEEHNKLAAPLFIKNDPGGVNGMGAAISAAFTQLLGTEDKAIDQATALRAVRALEWACQ